MIKRGATAVRITAHTDSSGPAAANLKLSDRRGRMVAAGLVRRGVKAELITVEPKGEMQPAVPSGDDASEPLNRPVVIDWTEPPRGQ